VNGKVRSGTQVTGYATDQDLRQLAVTIERLG